MQIRYPGLHPRDLIFLEPADITKHDPSVTLPGTLRVAQHVLKGVAEVSSEAEEDVIFATSSLCAAKLLLKCHEASYNCSDWQSNNVHSLLYMK